MTQKPIKICPPQREVEALASKQLIKFPRKVKQAAAGVAYLVGSGLSEGSPE